jgi:hypothetical protein
MTTEVRGGSQTWSTDCFPLSSVLTLKRFRPDHPTFDIVPAWRTPRMLLFRNLEIRNLPLPFPETLAVPLYSGCNPISRDVSRLNNRPSSTIAHHAEHIHSISIIYRLIPRRTVGLIRLEITFHVGSFSSNILDLIYILIAFAIALQDPFSFIIFDTPDLIFFPPNHGSYIRRLESPLSERYFVIEGPGEIPAFHHYTCCLRR